MKSKHFKLEELVCPEILAVCSPWAAWRLVSPFVWSLDMLRDIVDLPIMVNYNGLKGCGVRWVGDSFGAVGSSHKGLENRQGFDLHCSDIGLLVSAIKKHYKALGILRMENPDKTKTWVHVEISTKPVTTELAIFNP